MIRPVFRLSSPTMPVALSILVCLGCGSGTSDSPPEQAAAPSVLPAQEEPSAPPMPQWPPLPVSEFETRKQASLDSLVSMISETKFNVPDIKDIVPELKTSKARMEFALETQQDLQILKASVEEAAGTAIDGLRVLVQQFIAGETRLQSETAKLIKARLDWYSRNLPNAPEMAELTALLNKSKAVLQSLEKPRTLLGSRPIRSVSEAVELRDRISGAALEDDFYSKVLTISVAVFDSAQQKVQHLENELLAWGLQSFDEESAPIQRELTQLKKVLEQQFALHAALSAAQSNAREQFKGDDEQWAALKGLIRAIKKTQPAPVRKTILETCSRMDIFREASVELMIDGSDPTSTGKPELSDELLQQLAKETLTGSRVHTLAQRAQLNAETLEELETQRQEFAERFAGGSGSGNPHGAPPEAQ
jgi:hypothetical protein